MQLHRIQGYIQTMYLAEYPDKLMLLDGASRADIPHLKDFIEHQLNRPFADLKLVVVTHMHPDHAGAAHKLRDLTGCQLLAAKRETHWYGGLDGWLMHLTDWQILETPGHTDRDLSVYHAEQDVLYVADLMVQVKSHLIAPFPIFHPNQYRSSLKRVFEMNPSCLLAAHGGEVEFDEDAYQHIINTAPVRPITHWRVTKIKLKGLMRSVLRRKNDKQEKGS